MPRPLRITVPNLPFHVLDRRNNRQIIFQEEEDFIYFLKLLKRYKKELKFKLYHFCLMPNHIHFAEVVVQPEDWRWSNYNFYAPGKIDPLIEEKK